MGKIVDLTGERFGRLVVIERDTTKKGSYWKCRCDCGNICSIRADHLKRVETISCGCVQKEKTK